eukprot:tig00000498_g1599.t1
MGLPGVCNEGVHAGPFLFLEAYARDVINILQNLAGNDTMPPAWCYGEFWGLDSSRGTLSRTDMYVTSGALDVQNAQGVENYRGFTSRLAFAPHQDVFGSFLPQRGIVYEPDLWYRGHFTPGSATAALRGTVVVGQAVNAGFRSVLGVPIHSMDGNQIIGAILFFGFHARPPGMPPCATLDATYLVRIRVDSPADLERCLNPVFTKRLLDPFAGSGFAALRSAAGGGARGSGGSGGAGRSGVSPMDSSRSASPIDPPQLSPGQQQLRRTGSHPHAPLLLAGPPAKAARVEAHEAPVFESPAAAPVFSAAGGAGGPGSGGPGSGGAAAFGAMFNPFDMFGGGFCFEEPGACGAVPWASPFSFQETVLAAASQAAVGM